MLNNNFFKTQSNADTVALMRIETVVSRRVSDTELDKLSICGGVGKVTLDMIRPS